MATWPASLPGGSSASVRKCYGEWWVGVVYLFALERYSGARAGLCLECGFSSVGRACISGFLSPPFFDLVRQRFGLRSHLPTLVRVWGLCGVVAWAPFLHASRRVLGSCSADRRFGFGPLRFVFPGFRLVFGRLASGLLELSAEGNASFRWFRDRRFCGLLLCRRWCHGGSPQQMSCKHPGDCGSMGLGALRCFASRRSPVVGLRGD